jgi:uncharacterized membrane protein (UPF0127 family)
MKILNRSKNTFLAQDARIADSFFARMFGLLGKKELKSGEALIIKPCNSVHTFFMHFTIDVLFVDKDLRVVKSISAIKPFRLSAIYPKADLAIELPSGSIDSTRTAISDQIEFV